MHKRALVLSALVPTLLLASAAKALPILQEVFYDPTLSPEADYEFTEIYGLPGMDLSGWTLMGINLATLTPYRTVDLTGAVIPADGLLVIATATAEPSLAAIRDFTANVEWQNGPDALQLIDPFSNVVDALQYGGAISGFGEGNPAVDVAQGFSLSRDLLGTDTDDNASDFSQSAPSPGVGPAPVPEPSTGLLLAAGLALLAARRRRRA